MKLSEAKRLPPGLYRIWWKDGSMSLAAVGRTANGTPWIAPSNWISVLTGPDAGKPWQAVKSVNLIWCAPVASTEEANHE